MAGVTPEVAMLMILLATCEQTHQTLQAADNPIDAELTTLLETMIVRTRAEVEKLTREHLAGQ